MNRKEKIYLALQGSEIRLGLEALEVAELTGIDRANVSRKLNELVREEKVVKLSGRPVRYMDRKFYEQLQKEAQSGETKETLETEPQFFFMIGQNGSLKKQIAQAKSAILYPPKGLRTLFLGPTGTGKTMFVERLYEYAKHMKVLDAGARLVIFNCAEYAENPQLILAQLFGYRKGAFTGADKDSEGLVEKANGGILFLDEIHRLPPDGQEMLFLLMDKGIYRKLGEPDKERKANVLIMGATTENIDKALLQTFLRRMPVAVTLPALHERPLEERLELVEYFFRTEQKNIGIPLYVSKEALISLIQYDCPGNIGQLRSDIQMICAQAFLEYKMEGRERLIVDEETIRENINTEYYKGGFQQNYLSSLLKHYDDFYMFFSESKQGGDSKGEKNSIFAEIIRKYNEYQAQGRSDREIEDSIENYLHHYMEKLVDKYKRGSSESGKNHLLSIIGPQVNSAVEDAVSFAELKLERKLSDRIKLGMKLHVNYMLERLEAQESIKTDGLKDMAIRYPRELQVAGFVRKILEEGLGVQMPEQELWVLTMFLCDKKEEEDFRKVGLIVLAHGNSTASSMAEVANALFDTDICQAIDMPLYGSVEETLEKTRRLAAQIDEGKGVLLLTDMGSLSGFGELLERESGQLIRAVDMVSTIVVVEAVRRTLIRGTDMDQLLEALCKIGKMRLVGSEEMKEDCIKTIITTCISGAGTAQKISEMIQKVLLDRKIQNIVIKNMDITDAEHAQEEVKKRGLTGIIAVVGTVDLKLKNIPYISIESLVMGNGMPYLEELVIRADLNSSKEIKSRNKNVSEHRLLTESMKKLLEFLDADKAEETVSYVYNRIAERIHMELPRGTYVRFVIHTCCMIERVMKGEVLAYKELETLKAEQGTLFELIESEMRFVQDKFSIQISMAEIAYIVELFAFDLAQES